MRIERQGLAGLRRSTAMPLVVGVVGRSGTGKTSLLERLIPALARSGLDVGAVKHASHGFHADRRGKDSHRLYEAGADSVALISRDQVATFSRRDPGIRGELGLVEVLAGLPSHLDVVLAEGFSWEPIPRFVLVRAGGEPAPEYLSPGEVLSVVPVDAPPPGAPPHFSDALIEALIRSVARCLRTAVVPAALRITGYAPATV